MTSGAPVWITLLAGLGIGSVVAACVSWWSTKAVTISNHRQNWINALRDDIVTYLKDVEVVHYRVGRLSGTRGEPTTADLEALQEARNAALFVYRRILLRLNISEPLHTELGQVLEGLLHVENTTADHQHIDDVIAVARRVHKHEWAVTKYGMFTRPVLAFKRALKRNV